MKKQFLVTSIDMDGTGAEAFTTEFEVEDDEVCFGIGAECPVCGTGRAVAKIDYNVDAYSCDGPLWYRYPDPKLHTPIPEKPFEARPVVLVAVEVRRFNRDGSPR